MIKCFEKSSAFSLAEALITMLILGIVMSLIISGVKLYNPTEKGQRTLSWKMAENIESATLQILLNHSSYDDFKRIKDKNGYFSIEDNNITERMSKLYSKYLSDINYNVNLKDEYFAGEIIDYDRVSTGEKLQDAYSNFFYVTDGMLIGFRFYKSCSATEKNSTPPEHKGRFSIDNVCGSIFYDINSFKGPNKLGSDQYILPVGKRGIKYNNE